MYEIQHNTLADGWVNTWTTVQDGVETPETFLFESDAQLALDEFFLDIQEAVADGDLEDGYSRDEFRIVKIEERL